MSDQARQRAFKFSFAADQRLDTFETGECNVEAWLTMREIAEGRLRRVVFLYGPSGSGKTHLLRAVTRALGADGCYYDLQSLPGAFELPGEIGPLLSIDHVERLSIEQPRYLTLWELFNRYAYADRPIVIAGRQPPSSLERIDDHLRSRFASGLIIALRPVDDQARERILHRWAGERSLPVKPNVVQYILTHAPRNVSRLQQLLADLDQASLAARRKVSIPLVKELLETADSKNYPTD